MEQDFIQIRDTLADNIPQLQTIDEDTGQLEALLNGEESYPLVFPAALITFSDCEWTNYIGTSKQTGKGSFSIKLAFDCYDDTHRGAGQDSYAIARHTLCADIHAAIHCQSSIHTGKPFYRTRSRSYTLPGNIKVYEQEYSYSAVE